MDWNWLACPLGERPGKPHMLDTRKIFEEVKRLKLSKDPDEMRMELAIRALRKLKRKRSSKKQKSIPSEQS
jgi:hypothetical protein